MPRLTWLTDIHLNFVEPAAALQYLDEVVETQPDALLITGDIAEATGITQYLTLIAEHIQRPIYFVLGNHDFYHGSIHEVRRQVTVLCESYRNLHYLTSATVAELSPQLAIVGHDGWADGRLGDYERSFVMMNDYTLIAELAGHNKLDRWQVLMALADEAAAHVRNVLPAALERYPHVFFLTHVPPFKEACWHEGHTSDNEWLPHFTCKAVGDALLEIMRDRPDRKLTVLCGHTHSSGECRPLDNIEVLTGGALYGYPSIQRVFEDRD